MSDSEWFTEIPLVETPDLTPSEFCLRGWMKSEVYKLKAGTRGELLARFLDVAAWVEKVEDHTPTNNARSSYTSCKVL